MVRLRIFLPSRQASRSKIAGLELRFGIVSIYMATIYTIILPCSKEKNNNYMGTNCRFF